MRKDRLLKLADFLETLPSKKFNLKHWKQTRSCGTTACAAGWACSLFNNCRSNTKLVLVADSICPELKYVDYSIESKDGEYCGMEAVARFFGISPSNADNIFHPSSYPNGHRGPKYVANRIRQFVKNGKIKSKYLLNK